MFELIVGKLPELQKLEATITDLEGELGKAQAKAAALANKVAQAREDDLNREAMALNAGTRPPKPQEPRLREQLEDAQRELAVLERRRMLADQARSRFIADNHERLAALLAEAQEAAGATVAEGASTVLEDLLRLFAVEDDARALGRLAPAPAPENDGPPERITAVFGPVHHATVAGPRRGDLESTLRYLMSLGPPTEVGPAEGEAGAA